MATAQEEPQTTPAPTESAAPPAQEDTLENQIVLTSARFDTLMSDLDRIIKELREKLREKNDLRKDIKLLEQRYKKLRQKGVKKKRTQNGQPLGFARPQPITTEMKNFIVNEFDEILNQNVEVLSTDTPQEAEEKETLREQNRLLREKIEAVKNTEGMDCKIARTDVTKLISKYCIYHKLQKPDEKRRLLLQGKYGKKLNAILAPYDPNDLDFINIQKYISHHFYSKKRLEQMRNGNTSESGSESTTTVTTDTATEPTSTEQGEDVVLKKNKIKRKLKRPATNTVVA
jgi:hypothetical protein